MTSHDALYYEYRHKCEPETWKCRHRGSDSLGVCSGCCLKRKFIIHRWSTRESWESSQSIYADSTHWGQVTHICVGKLTIIGSDNGLSPGRRQAIIWTNAGILWFGPLRSNFSEILIEIDTFSLKKMHLKLSSAKWRPFCLGLNVLKSCAHKYGQYHPLGSLPGSHLIKEYSTVIPILQSFWVLHRWET